jgi:anti-anti-sigma factor
MAKELQLSLAERTEDGINVFRFSGDLGVEGATGVAGLFQACLKEKVYKIIVDLQDVNFVSSAGMGAFLSVVSELRTHGGDIVFVKMGDKVARVFESLDVLDYFIIAPDIKTAKSELRTKTLAEPRLKTIEKEPVALTIAPEPRSNVFRNMLSLLAAYSDILDSGGSLGDKLTQVLEATATYLSLTRIAIANLSESDLGQETAVGGPLPPTTKSIRRQLRKALLGKPSEISSNIADIGREAKEWLVKSGTRLIFPLTSGETVASAIIVGEKKTRADITPEEKRILRYLCVSINLLFENIKLKKTPVKAGESERISGDRRRLEKKLIETETLYMVSRELASNVDINKILPVFLVILVGQMSTDKGILLLKGNSGLLKVAGARGIREKEVEGFMLPPDRGIAKELLDRKSPIPIEFLDASDQAGKKNVERLMGSGISILTPIIFKDELIGIVGLGSKVSKTAYTEDELRLLVALGNLAGISIENARLFGKIKETYTDVVRAMVNAIEARDKYARGHTERVTRYANAFGRGLGLNKDEMQTLMLGAVLHDIGYLGVSEAALTEPNSLSGELRVEIQRHPLIGHQILKEIKFLEGSINIVKHHHERWDGTGYPNGLAAEEIPFGARVLSLCDALDAMTSDRRYRNALEPGKVITEILKNSGFQFDPILAEAFVNMIKDGTVKIIKPGS